MPKPRFRLYTDAGQYSNIVKDFFLCRFRSGNSIGEIEGKMARYFNVKHAIFTPTARSAIYLVLSSLIRPGQKVVLSPITIVDVINMVLCAGGIPEFVDVQKSTCNIDPEKTQSALDQDTGAVLITHLHGLSCDIGPIIEFCAQKGIPLIEDAAQAFSTKYQGQYVGTFGKAGVFSFGLYKNITSFFGGMIVTNDDQLNEKIRSKLEAFSYMGYSGYLSKVGFGGATDISTSNFLFPFFTYPLFRFAFMHKIDFLNDIVTVDKYPKRLDQIPKRYLHKMMPGQARLIKKQLEKVETNNKKRIEAARLYHEGLSGISGIVCPPFRDDGSHIYTYYPFQFSDRKRLMRFSYQHSRDWVLSHYRNCASLDIFKEFHRHCPNAQNTADNLIYLPTYPRYPRREIEKNIKIIKDFFNK